MKPPIYRFLWLFLASQYAYAQVPHTLTIADLQQLADCPDQYCLGSRVNQEGYTYKGPQKGKSDGLEGTQYKYIRPHPNPMFTEFAASYWVMKDNTRRVSFTSDNKVWIAGLTSAIEQSGFTFIRQKGMFGHKEFVHIEGGRTWHLNWAEPRLLVDAEPHTLTVYSDTQPTPSISTATLPIQTAMNSPQSGEPHLGGHWDTGYPVLDAAKLLQAERRYAADYERGHGKTGNTFSRCEKVRIRATSKGQYRPLTTDRWAKSFADALRHTGFDAFADNRDKLYKQELLVDVAGESLWMPIQEIIIKSLEKEAKVGEVITLYAVLVSHHDFGGTLHLSFLINEFAAVYTTDNFDGDDKPKPQPAKPLVSTIATQKPTTGCGFNWKPWVLVSATERVEMKKVMVTQYLEPAVSLSAFIAAEIARGNKIQVARYDFFKDGQPGYVIYIEYKTPQDGDKGRVEVFENLVKLKLWPSAHVKSNLCAVQPFDDGKPAYMKRGVIGEDSHLGEFLGDSFFEEEYAQFLRSTGQTAPVKSSTARPNTIAPVRTATAEDFKTFIQRFSTDRAFQLSRVKFPLIWKSSFNDDPDLIRRYTAATWKPINLVKPSGSSYALYTNLPTKPAPNSASVMETCRLGDCGYGRVHTFTCITGRWYLLRVNSSED